MIVNNQQINIPTVMFHSVGNNKSSWSKKWLSVSLEHFEEFCKYLQRKKYESLFLNEWYCNQNRDRLLRTRQIVITLDDGYLDNWVYAYPILKKYGLKGTIFINPEFVDPTNEKRPTLEDVWNGKMAIEELKTLGYLNWEEIKFMDTSGIVDIQSHSMSHNFYFTTDTLVDFYKNQNDYHWLAWVKRPDRKSFWITEDQRDFIPAGYPVFEYDRALGLRRFFPSEHFIDSFISKYNDLKQANSENIKKQLIEFTANYKDEYNYIGRYESDEESYERYRYEIYESKRVLEKILNKKVEYLCWPGGSYNDISIQMSIDAGYKASTIASWDNQRKYINSSAYKRIRRFGLGSFLKFNGKYIYNKNTKHLIHSFLSKRGNSYYKNLARLNNYYHLLLIKSNLNK